MDIGYRFTDRNSCCLLKIYVPRGSKIIPILYGLSYFDEQECLLPPGGTYGIIRRYKEYQIQTYDIEYTPHNSDSIEGRDSVIDIITAIDPLQYTARRDRRAYIEELVYAIDEHIDPALIMDIIKEEGLEYKLGLILDSSGLAT